MNFAQLNTILQNRQIESKIKSLNHTSNRTHKNNFNFNIYKKTTQNDTIIPSNSNHPFLKIDYYFNFLLYKLKRIPLNQFNYES